MDNNYYHKYKKYKTKYQELQQLNGGGIFDKLKRTLLKSNTPYVIFIQANPNTENETEKDLYENLRAKSDNPKLDIGIKFADIEKAFMGKAYYAQLNDKKLALLVDNVDVKIAQDKVSKSVGQVKQTISAIGDDIKTKAADVATDIQRGVSSTGRKISSALKDAKDAVDQKISQTSSAIKMQVVNTLLNDEEVLKKLAQKLYPHLNSVEQTGGRELPLQVILKDPLRQNPNLLLKSLDQLNAHTGYGFDVAFIIDYKVVGTSRLLMVVGL